MSGLRQTLPGKALSHEFAMHWARPVLTAHLRAWMAAEDETARDLLFLELEDLWEGLVNLPAQPAPPAGARGWPAWVRWADRMQAAQFRTEADAARAWDAARGLPRQPATHPLRAARVELHRLLTSEALFAEGRAMENCIHDWRDHLVDGTAAIYSLRLARTGEHIGTAAVGMDEAAEACGRANGRLVPEHRREAMLLLMRERVRLWGAAPQADADIACDAPIAKPEPGRRRLTL
jgi:hypothetical protein